MNAPWPRDIPTHRRRAAFEAPRRPEFGDFATNVSFPLAKVARRSPQDVALALIEDVRAADPERTDSFAGIEPVAGFINLRLAPQIWQNTLGKP